MNEIIEYESVTKGLWRRFVTKIIGAFILNYYAAIFLIAIFNSWLPPMIIIFIIVIVLFLALRQIILDNPLKWRNTITIDFDREKIEIANNKSDSRESEILDLDGQSYSFDEIDSYSTVHYESFLFSAYYLVKLHVNNKEIKLLSIKDAQEFTNLIKIFNNKLKLKIKQ